MLLWFLPPNVGQGCQTQFTSLALFVRVRLVKLTRTDCKEM